MSLVQFLIIGLVILFLIKTTSDFKKKRISLYSFLFWLFLWAVIFITALAPQITEFIAKIVGIKRGTDVAVYFSILFIFFLLFKVISRLEVIDHEITKIVRRIALEDKEK